MVLFYPWTKLGGICAIRGTGRVHHWGQGAPRLRFELPRAFIYRLYPALMQMAVRRRVLVRCWFVRPMLLTVPHRQTPAALAPRPAPG